MLRTKTGEKGDDQTSNAARHERAETVRQGGQTVNQRALTVQLNHAVGGTVVQPQAKPGATVEVRLPSKISFDAFEYISKSSLTKRR